MTAQTWPAPAKVNHFLHIMGRRADGYHLLQTVFQFLDLADQLRIAVTADGQVRCEGNYPQASAPEDLALRAAQVLQQVCGVAEGAEIYVHKRVPIGGGLGGGSSDAATTLTALNHLWGIGLTTDQLAALGLRLGADVPVFVRGFAAWAEGTGERLTPLELPENWFLLIHPNCRVSTAAVFKDPDLERDAVPITPRDFLAGAALRNDCEPVARRICPEVGAALDWLAGRGAEARLSGTGAGVFAAFQREDKARALLAELPAQWRGFVTRGRNRSPLVDAAARAARADPPSPVAGAG